MKEAKGQLIFRHTNARKGRSISITPDNSAMKHLVYGRIILDEQHPSEKFSTGPLETGLICLSGECTVKAGGQTTKIDQYDSVYLPRDTEVEIATDSSVDLVECSAEVEKKYPLQIVRYADVEKDSSLKFKTGGPSTTRTVNITLGKNIEAGRILAGFTTSEPGHWTSWPPHEHASILEELYVYYDMPAPAFGVQFVYTNPDEPEFAGGETSVSAEEVARLHEALTSDDDTLWEMSANAMLTLARTEDFAKGPRAFIEKRPPVWKGK